MSLVKKLEFPEAKFDLYFLGYNSAGARSPNASTFDRQGLIELTHNYGTEDDASYAVNNGNKSPHRGFGHTCISVDNIQAACQRIEDKGYRFQKKLTDGRMKEIAFALDPDGYWVEIIGQNPVESTADVKTTDAKTYRMVRSPFYHTHFPDLREQNHTMIRVRDIQKSLKFYQDILGMSLVWQFDAKEAGFSNYFLGYNQLGPDAKISEHEGLLELTWNYGTESDESFKYHNGNDQPQGFGHLCKFLDKIVYFCNADEYKGVSVDNIDGACERFEELKADWKKRLTDGRMKNVAFLLDPDGYWVEIVQNERFSGKENF